MRRLSLKRLFVWIVVFVAICLAGAFWIYRANLPDEPSVSNNPAQPVTSLFEIATGKQPEDIVRKIQNQLNVTLYPVYGSTLSGRYSLSFDYSPNCEGNATACYFGDIFISSSPIGTPEPGTAVQLQNGVTAYFIDFKCGASCGVPRLNWRKGDHFYRVAL